MPVVKMLDCSTANITRADADVLSLLTADGKNAFAGVRIVPHEYGWFVSVPSCDHVDEAAREMRDALLSPHFVRLVGHAKEMGCQWVNLDRDAEPEDALPAHSW